MNRCFRYAVSSLALLATAASAQDFPARKPGLWEMVISSEGMPPKKARHCIDETTDKQMQAMGQSMMSDTCSKSVWRKEGDKLINETECKFGDVDAFTRTVVSGDFHSSYRSEMESKYHPPLLGRTEGKAVVEARWVSACPKGWNAGDMEMEVAPGQRMRMNIDEVAGDHKSVK